MRISLGIEYDGSHFQGWQRQPECRTVQATLELALSEIAQESIQVYCAGRTDAGVHAVGQVIHFDAQTIRTEKAWLMGGNTLLPKDVVIRWCKFVAHDFHARFSARSRTYRYLIYNEPSRPALLLKRATWELYPLNIEAMQEAALNLQGEHDFSSFRSSECQSHSPFRQLHHIHIQRQPLHELFPPLIVIEVKANAFLHHMVRNIVGTLLPVGKGQKSPSWVQEVLQAKTRTAAGITAPPQGLYLTSVEYPNDV